MWRRKTAAARVLLELSCLLLRSFFVRFPCGSAAKTARCAPAPSTRGPLPVWGSIRGPPWRCWQLFTCRVLLGHGKAPTGDCRRSNSMAFETLRLVAFLSFECEVCINRSSAAAISEIYYSFHYFHLIYLVNLNLRKCKTAGHISTSCFTAQNFHFLLMQPMGAIKNSCGKLQCFYFP